MGSGVGQVSQSGDRCGRRLNTTTERDSLGVRQHHLGARTGIEPAEQTRPRGGNRHAIAASLPRRFGTTDTPQGENDVARPCCSGPHPTARAHRSAARARLVAGPVLFESVWLVLGFVSDGYTLVGHTFTSYSPISQPISGLGMGETAPIMNAAFVLGGLGHGRRRWSLPGTST